MDQIKKESMNYDNTKNSYKEKIAATCLLISVVSFGGFLIESIFVAVTLRYVDNRNMVLPFLLGYGLAMAAIYLLFGTPTAPRLLGMKFHIKNIFLCAFFYFCAVFLAISIGEGLLGIFVEKVCDVIWWDYSSIPLHITKFTSVPTSTAFTALIMIFMHFCYLPLYNLFREINKKVLYTLAIVSMILLTADCIFSGVRMYLTGDFLTLWKIAW